MSLLSLFSPVKDYATEVAVKLWFNQTKKSLGQMTHIKIDSQAKRIDVELALKGETTPIQIQVKSYDLTSEGGETFIQIGEIETSREWINSLINDYLKPDQRRFKVPGAVKAILS